MNGKTIIEKIQNGDTIALSKAITLCESKLESEQNIAQIIIAALSKKNGNSIRIGVTGIPGVGKALLLIALEKC